MMSQSPAYGVVEGRPQVAFPGGDGWLYVFEPETGKLLWKFNCRAHEKLKADGKTETQNNLVATPVYAGHRVLIAVGDNPENGDSPGGLVETRMKGELVSVAMGVPNFDPASLPFEASGEAYVYPLSVGTSEIEVGAVSIGNPHAVIRHEPDRVEVRGARGRPRRQLPAERRPDAQREDPAGVRRGPESVVRRGRRRVPLHERPRRR